MKANDSMAGDCDCGVSGDEPDQRSATPVFTAGKGVLRKPSIGRVRPAGADHHGELRSHRSQWHDHGYLHVDGPQWASSGCSRRHHAWHWISPSYVAAVLPKGQEDYTSYTTSSATGTMLGTIPQPGADSGGAVTSVGPGQYTYTFHTVAPSGFDTTATHTIGVYGSRNLTPYNLPTNYASATYNFVPNGSKVTQVHDIIETASCNNCHDQLSAHGGSRRGMNMCVLCHTPQNTDPNTGDTLDAKVFFHKLHMGASLPSVISGTPYIPASNSHGTFNYSTVVFPADPGDPRRCEVCHSQTTGAAQATAFLLNPTRAACGACHDNVNFATGLNHPGGIQNDDTLCADCHIPQGEMDFDASILGAHVAPTASTVLAGLAVKITKVQNSTAGSAPTVSFTVLNTAKQGVPLSQLGSISFTMAGLTGLDYGAVSFGSDVSTPGYVTESAAKATCDGNGNCMYTFTHPVPAKATGTYAIGVEARRTDMVPTLGQRDHLADEYPVWSAESGRVLLSGRFQSRGPAHGGGAGQLQPMPHIASASRNAAQQHRVLRDVPQSE